MLLIEMLDLVGALLFTSCKLLIYFLLIHLQVALHILFIVAEKKIKSLRGLSRQGWIENSFLHLFTYSYMVTNLNATVNKTI